MRQAPPPPGPVEYARIMRELVWLLSKLDELGRREIAFLIISPEELKSKSKFLRMREALIRQWVPQMPGGNRSRQVKEFLAQWTHYLKTRYIGGDENFSILPAKTDEELRAEEPFGVIPRDILHRISWLNEGVALSDRRIFDILDGKDE